MYNAPNFGKVISVAAQGTTYNAVSAPIFLKPLYKMFSSTVGINIPGSGAAIDLVALEANMIATAATGTAPTVTTKFQGCNDITDITTTVNAAVATTDTAINFVARDGIAQYGYVLLVSADGKKYEWVFNTTAATTGSGTLTVTRAQFGTTAQAFAIGDYVGTTNSWVDIPSANSSTTTLTTAATNVSGAAVSIPLTSALSSQQLGMNSIDWPIIRAVAVVNGSANTATASFTVMASGKTRAKFDNAK